MYIGYTIGFIKKKTRWCCLPFTAPSPFFTLHHFVSLFPSLYSEPPFYYEAHSHSSLLLLEAISDLFGAELRKCLFQKEKGYVKFLTATQELNRF